MKDTLKILEVRAFQQMHDARPVLIDGIEIEERAEITI